MTECLKGYGAKRIVYLTETQYLMAEKGWISKARLRAWKT